MMNQDMSVNDGVLLLCFLVSVNFLMGKVKDFSCHTQTWLTDNLVAKHSFNLVAVFFVIVLFTRSSPINPNLILFITFVMYAFFICITKCEYRFLATFLLVMFVAFYIEAMKSYLKRLDKKNGEKNVFVDKLSKIGTILQYVALGIIIIGVVVYMGQRSREYGETWTWIMFWFGNNDKGCLGNGLPKHLKRSIPIDFVDGLRRILGMNPMS